MGILETLALIVTCLLQLKGLKENGKTEESSYKIYVGLLLVLVVVALVKIAYLFGVGFGEFVYKLIN